MNKFIFTLLVILFSATAVYSQTFYLRYEKTGKRYGPYEFKDGEGIKIGSEEFTLLTRAGNSNVKEKLRQLVIPHLEMEEVTVSQAVSYLKAKSKQLDPQGNGIKIVIANPKNNNSAKEFSFEEGPVDNVDNIMTFEADNIPLGQVLTIIAEQTDYEWTIKKDIVVFKREQ